jgi:type II secretory pathway pseudopilin PulG
MRRIRTSRGARRVGRSGITLLESLLAAILLAMVVVSVLAPFTAGAKAAAEDARQAVAVSVAQDLMEEILSQAFRDPDGVDDEASRWDYDDVDDYDDYSEAEGQMRSFDGGRIDEPAATYLSRQVSVTPVYVAGQDTEDEATFLQVVVEVRYHGITVLQLTRLVYANE